MAFHPLLAFFVINVNKVIFNDIVKFFVKFDFKDWLKITPKPYADFAHIEGEDLVGEILNYWEACNKLIGLRNIIRIPYLDRLAEELEYAYYIDDKLDDPDLPEYIKPLCDNYYLCWQYHGLLYNLLDGIVFNMQIARELAFKNVYHGPNGRPFNKLYRRDDIGIFNPDYEDLNDDGMVTGLDQKAVYVDVHKWIEHLEALVLVEPYRELVVIKSAYLEF